MAKMVPKPNDPAEDKERLNKTISNMEAAKEAMQYAEGRELAAIKEKNARRKNIIEDLQEEVDDEDKPHIISYK